MLQLEIIKIHAQRFFEWGYTLENTHNLLRIIHILYETLLHFLVVQGMIIYLVHGLCPFHFESHSQKVYTHQVIFPSPLYTVDIIKL
ncbi:hypothetical protein D1872_279940 [compost metagenome]